MAKMRPSTMIRCAAMALATCGAALPAFPAFAQRADAVPEARRAAAQWFQDAKFGVFLHWGLYSELAGGGDRTVAEWIMHERRIPAAKYERLAAFFNPGRFDAEQWVRTIREAGARYVVITAKHHDGFAMFDSKVSDYNVVRRTPFARDPMKALAEACRRQDIKLFFYYSQLDWHHPDYYPRGTTGQFSGRPEQGEWDRYVDFQNAQLRELLTQYGPIGGIWFDGWWDQMHTPMRERWRLKETYDLIHSLQPQALIVNNHHQLPFPGEDYQTFERDLPGANTMGYSAAGVGALPLETAETMNGSWGFNLLDSNFKPVDTLIRSLVGAAGRNANFLLNTGPMPNGELQPENVTTYAAIGRWLKTYGASIYGTRGGPVPPRAWGVTTQKEGTVYVHILDWNDARLFVPIAGDVVAATVLETGRPTPWRAAPGGIELLDAARPEGVVDRVIAVRLRHQGRPA